MENEYKYLIITLTILAIVAISILFFSGADDSQTIQIVGSTSMEPIAERLSQAYMKKHPEVKIIVQGGDSEVGVKSVRRGTVDIGMSSRNLTSQESEGICQMFIANGGIAIIVNNNNPVNDLTKEQVTDIFSGHITNWKEVGGNDEPITVINREVGSGTRLSLEQLTTTKITENAMISLSSKDMMHDVAVLPNAVGFVASSAINADINEVKVLKINNVSLTKETVKSGEYPLNRPLLFLVKGTPTGVIKDFLEFVQSPEGQVLIY